jgi:hypothetical protein
MDLNFSLKLHILNDFKDKNPVLKRQWRCFVLDHCLDCFYSCLFIDLLSNLQLKAFVSQYLFLWDLVDLSVKIILFYCAFKMNITSFFCG